ncbi:scavenger receptor cysteine-rich type 1 protein M130-like [Dreissena polymorpha]|uniref:scavenger receptor cysteine-rich type 1 protein M130-like n=1 Tax=Dreissena polymorpha TaxID=45954 RepID=UPI002264B448|nr:scavenger receptor cysteine-rich type 1 protein M130-like [Dreissena polymorpha]
MRVVRSAMVYLAIFILNIAYGALAQNNSQHHGNVTQARLVGGSSNGEGLLQLYYKGEWVHISASYGYFTRNDAKVVCSMLGYGNSTVAYPLLPDEGGSLFGSLTSRSWNDQRLNCRGTETDIKQCSGWSNSFSLSTTDHGFTVALLCERPQLRLQNGDTPYSGRVELYFQNRWRPLCGYNFGHAEARAVCNTLGFHNTGIAVAFTGSHFGKGTVDPIISKLNCKGNEAHIFDCSPYFESACTNMGDRTTAGVNCNKTRLRLVGGPTNTSGRVEVLQDGTWGTICGDFSGNAVTVICRMIGVNNPQAFGYGHNYYGEGHGNIVIKSLSCDGTETDISMCRSYYWAGFGNSFYVSCDHSKDAGVNCDGKTPIRLVDGVSEQSGRLEVFHNGHWGTVGSSNFDDHDLDVICRMLGFNYSSKSFYEFGYYGEGYGEIVVSSLSCQGHESDIGHCAATWWPIISYDHRRDVGVNCNGVIPIRLGGPGNATAGMGRVEFLHNNHYATICSKGFDRVDLMVVCRMLGFDNIPASAHWFLSPNQGFGEIGFSQLHCLGIEDSIGHCLADKPASGCSHADDVNVNCLGATEILRLVGGSKNYTGRVELYHTGQWGTICDTSFDKADAVVICRILGFPNPERALAYSGGHFGSANSSVPSLMTYLRCNGLETTLSQCNPTWAVNECSHSHDVGVDCCPNCQQAGIIG